MNTKKILPTEPYEGEEPYLFISYSHKNNDQVWPVIAAMQRRGFHIWYDNGIQVGTEFNTIIAEKLEGCSVLLSFNTDELFASKYCMQELLYAAENEKNIVNICFPLSSKAPSWFRLRFETTYQQIYRNRFATEEALLDELCRATILQKCRSLTEEQRKSEDVQNIRKAEERRKTEDTRKTRENFEIENEVLLKYIGKGGDVTIPSGVTIIGERAFSNCTYLTSIAIHSSVTIIGERAFSYCENLTNITIPDSVTIIGTSAFSDCESLTNITIPDGVTSIGQWAFAGCKRLTSITLPSSVTRIGNGAFSDCESLTINLADGNSQYRISGNCLIEIASGILISGCKNSVIPNDSSVKIIGDYAFSSRKSLTSITIPDSVTSIGYRAFWNCTSLTSIIIPDNVTSIGLQAFWDCTNLTSITIPSNMTSVALAAFHGCEGLTSITIPDNVTSIGKGALDGCKRLTNITFQGTINEWNAIDKGEKWDDRTGKYIIHCADGDIQKNRAIPKLV